MDSPIISANLQKPFLLLQEPDNSKPNTYQNLVKYLDRQSEPNIAPHQRTFTNDNNKFLNDKDRDFSPDNPAPEAEKNNEQLKLASPLKNQHLQGFDKVRYT